MVVTLYNLSWRTSFGLEQLASGSSLREFVYLRSHTILPNLIGKRIKVHTGKKELFILVRRSMVGYKLGEFSLTKKMGSLIHSKRKGKRKKKGK